MSRLELETAQKPGRSRNSKQRPIGSSSRISDWREFELIAAQIGERPARAVGSISPPP